MKATEKARRGKGKGKSKASGAKAAPPRPAPPRPAQVSRFLDRLVLLEQLIPREDVALALAETGCLDKRRCTLSFEVTTWLVLAAAVLTDLPLRAVFRASVGLLSAVGAYAPCRAALCTARRRLGVAPVRRLFLRTARPLATPGLPGGFYRGLRLVAIDSTTLSVPDSPANVRAFGRPSAGDRGDAAFPLIRKTSLVELGTRAELALVVKPGARGKGTGEQSAAPPLCRNLKPGMLLLYDRGFYGYELWRIVLGREADTLCRVGSRPNLPVRVELPDGSYLSKVYRNDHRKNREGATWVRVVRYTHDDPLRVGCGEEHRLMTTLLDHLEYPAAELIALYHERWEIESAYDEQKTHHAPVVPGKEANLRSETPAGVVQEVYALSIGHYVTRAVMAEAAAREGIDPDRLSFVGTLRILRDALPDYAYAPPERKKEAYAAILDRVAAERLPPRRDRINPRVVRRKMSRYLKKRECHKGPQTVTQPYMIYVVILR